MILQQNLHVSDIRTIKGFINMEVHLFLVFYQKGTMWHLAIMMLLLLFC